MSYWYESTVREISPVVVLATTLPFCSRVTPASSQDGMTTTAKLPIPVRIWSRGVWSSFGNWGIVLALVDRLLLYLMDEAKNVTIAMRADGYGPDEVSAAYNEARRLGWIESTGLGMDRLTPRGWERAADIKIRNPDP